MTYWDAIGRAIAALEPLDEANRIADFLNRSGLSATVSTDPDSDLYAVLVPKDEEYASVGFMETYRKRRTEMMNAESEYRSHVLSPSPDIVPSEEKFRYETNSSVAFMLAGAVIFIMAVIHFFFILRRAVPGVVADCIPELIFGSVFLVFGMSSQQKVKMLRTAILQENAFNDRIVNWCTTTYSAEHIDKVIDAAGYEEDLTDAEMASLRRTLLKDYILREYDITDNAYLDYLVDLVYKRLYFPNTISAAM